MASITLKNLTKTYSNGVEAVKGLNLHIKDKEFVVIVGPSGCGKTSTLRMISGLETETEGEIFFNEQRMNDTLPKNRNVAMVFQNYTLFPRMSVFDNIAFVLKIKRYDKETIKKRVAEAAKLLEIGHLLNRKPKELSGGEKQRVALGRAIVRNPQAFLLDEPFSNLDANLRYQMRIEIAKLHRKLQTTTIYVTHDQIEAMTLAENIVVMKDGTIMQTGKPLEVYENPDTLFAAQFTGLINTLEVRLVSGSHDYKLFSGKSEGRELLFVVPKNKLQNHQNIDKYSDKNLILTIRPENIYIKNLETENAVNKDSHPISAICHSQEHKGYETLAYFTLSSSRTGEKLIMRIPPDKQIHNGEIVSLCMDYTKVLFFDPLTEKRID